MKKLKPHILLTLMTFGLLALNFTPAFAQITEIDILGGGYSLQSPATLDFGNVTASFTNQQTELAPRDNSEYLLITDRNGGNDFNVTVQSSDFTDESTLETFTADHLEVKNYDSNGDEIEAANAYTTLVGVELDASTDAYVTLDTARTLFTSDGHAPGSYKIFPKYRLTVEGGTLAGDYASTVTFTIN